MPIPLNTLKALNTLIKEENIPDNAVIVVERVEDEYFKYYGWNNSSTITNDITLTPCFTFSYNKKNNTIVIWMHC